ncbi:hypothetical protein ACFSJW_05445 [Flavobacterium artemisiae]|uniref:Uncharacterized protein n=1 Tax=Flavobacterium artemisiae TaxID=2126556 RepID=A0ABW4HK84_9FLAO
MSNYQIINSQNIFLITVIVIPITILSVWLFGLENHNSLFKNSLISTSILSVTFFLFISIGLFKGIKVRDNVGKITDRFDEKDVDFLKKIFVEIDPSDQDLGEDFLGIVFSLIVWFIMAFVISYLVWAFGAMIWFSILAFIAMLYWIFFRALRLVFRKSSLCRGNILNSILYAVSFTILYNFWIYTIIFIMHRVF